MADTTKIEWTDYTVNFWEGCQKFGPGCDNCYAEARDMRFTGGSHWGAEAPRRWVKGGIAKLRKINRNAEAFKSKNGHWPNVFCSSFSDVFDNAVDPTWHTTAFYELEAAYDTRPQLLTKRIGNVEKMVPVSWTQGCWPQHIGLMITIVNQAEADRDIPKLLALKAKLGIPWVGLSMEPLLGPVDLTDYCNGHYFSNWLAGTRWHEGPGLNKFEHGQPKLDWIIVGGESGRRARPMHPDWVRSLRDQCQAAGTAFFFKQWGEWGPDVFVTNNDPDIWLSPDGTTIDGGALEVSASDCQKPVCLVVRHGKKAAGRLLDGREWSEMPGVEI